MREMRRACQRRKEQAKQSARRRGRRSESRGGKSGKGNGGERRSRSQKRGDFLGQTKGICPELFQTSPEAAAHRRADPDLDRLFPAGDPGQELAGDAGPEYGELFQRRNVRRDPRLCRRDLRQGLFRGHRHLPDQLAHGKKDGLRPKGQSRKGRGEGRGVKRAQGRRSAFDRKRRGTGALLVLQRDVHAEKQYGGGGGRPGGDPGPDPGPRVTVLPGVRGCRSAVQGQSAFPGCNQALPDRLCRGLRRRGPGHPAPQALDPAFRRARPSGGRGRACSGREKRRKTGRRQSGGAPDRGRPAVPLCPSRKRRRARSGAGGGVYRHDPDDHRRGHG